MIALLGSIAILLLTCAVIVLFAMMGEVASRLGDSVARPTTTRDLLDANLGKAPTWWPAPIDADSPPSLALILSTSCQVCVKVSRSLAELGPDSLSDQTALVISCPNFDRGWSFAEEFALPNIGGTLVIDDRGEWARNELNIDISPSIVTFEGGTILAAYAFGSLDDLPPLAFAQPARD